MNAGGANRPDASLSVWIAAAIDAGAIARIGRAVDPVRDAAAVAWKLRNERGQGALFTAVEGFPGWRVAAQCLGARADWARTFGSDGGRLLFDLLGRMREPQPASVVHTGPIVQVEDRDTPAVFPMFVQCAADAGVESTRAVLVARDPDDGAVALALAGVQRMQGGRLGIDVDAVALERIFAKHVERRARVPVALVFGAHPALYLAAALGEAAVGGGYGLAGALLGGPLELVEPEGARVPLPAQGEMAIAGEVDPGFRVTLRAVGGSVGLPGRARGGHEFVARTQYRRSDPMLWSVQSGAPVTDCGVLRAMATELVVTEHVLPVESGVDIIDVRCPPQTGNLIVILKFRARVGGQSKTALLAALSSPATLPKLAIGVDEDVDVEDLRDVGWSMASRAHAELDVQSIPGIRVHVLDAASPHDPGPGAAHRVGTKWLFDATMPALTQPERREGFARAIPRNLDTVRLEDFLPPDAIARARPKA